MSSSVRKLKEFLYNSVPKDRFLYLIISPDVILYLEVRHCVRTLSLPVSAPPYRPYLNLTISSGPIPEGTSLVSSFCFRSRESSVRPPGVINV